MPVLVFQLLVALLCLRVVRDLLAVRANGSRQQHGRRTLAQVIVRIRRVVLVHLYTSA